ncbi:FtsX-like permease family protein [Clostridiales bacterium CHKCI001]|nr:FtsX-like permease family protein [Clostridiales bacterium CHKCI001]
MAFYQRAFLYLWRKRGKSLLLLLIILFVNTMILSTNMILHATEETKASMQEKSKSKVVCEITDADAQITAQDLEKMKSLPHVTSINRMGENSAFLNNAIPVTASGSEEDANWMVKLSSYDELEYDSPFVDRPYKLTKGHFLTAGSKNSAVVHADFAEKNGLTVGDEIDVEIEGGKSTTLKITGLYRAGNERKQDEATLAVHRLENQIFIDNTAYIELFDEDDFYKAAVYTDEPEHLEILADDLQTLLGDKTSIKGSDALYRQMKAPLEQITKVVEFMLILTFITGTAVISLLLCMWTKTRQKEMAVFISMGEGKIKIFLQAILESATLFLISVMAACGLGTYTAELLQKMLVSSSTAQISLQISLQSQDMALLLAIGGAVVLISVFLSVLPILKTNPRETLSRMEG